MGEKQWEGEIRWLSVLLGKGIKAYRKFDNGQKTEVSQSHLHSDGILSATSYKTVTDLVVSCDPGRSHRSRSHSKSRGRHHYSRNRSWGRYRGRYRRTGDRDRDCERDNRRKRTRLPKRKECWYCGEEGHVVMNCLRDWWFTSRTSSTTAITSIAHHFQLQRPPPWQDTPHTSAEANPSLHGTGYTLQRCADGCARRHVLMAPTVHVSTLKRKNISAERWKALWHLRRPLTSSLKTVYTSHILSKFIWIVVDGRW